MRVIISTIGTPPYGMSKCPIDIIRPTLNKKILLLLRFISKLSFPLCLY